MVFKNIRQYQILDRELYLEKIELGFQNRMVRFFYTLTES